MKIFLIILSFSAIVTSFWPKPKQDVPNVSENEIDRLINRDIFFNVEANSITRLSNVDEHPKAHCSKDSDFFKIRGPDMEFFLFKNVSNVNHSVLFRCNKQGRIMIADYKGFVSENENDVVTRHMRIRNCDDKVLNSEPRTIRYESWTKCPESEDVTLSNNDLKNALWASFDKYAKSKGYTLVYDRKYIIYTSEGDNGTETVFKVAK